MYLIYLFLELCSPLYSTATTILKCTDVSGREISCSEASHGTYLSYDCIAYYEAPLGYRKTLSCRDGLWSNTPVCQPSKYQNHVSKFFLKMRTYIRLKYHFILTVAFISFNPKVIMHHKNHIFNKGRSRNININHNRNLKEFQ